MIKIALITNTPPPYRVPIFARLAALHGVDFHVIFCARREPNRHWDLPPLAFHHHFLRERFITVDDRYIHHNPDVLPLLWRLAPDVVVTDGFNPTHLYAFLFAVGRGLPHVAMTDGTWQSEQALSLKHRLMRRLVYTRSQSFISASQGGDRLYYSYGVKPGQCFHSWLCINNENFAPMPQADKKRFDFIFCGRFEAAKDPLFALAVARQAAIDMQKRLRILFVGSGNLDHALRAAALTQADWLEVHFHGFASQNALPGLYRSARLFLFPTHADVWGIVTNEACAAGLPVLITPYAGAAGELVQEGKNGFVRELNIGQWADCARHLLENEDLYARFSARSLEQVAPYNFDSAAQGLIDACNAALTTKRRHAAVRASRTQRQP
jgi:glycosyltransferase involved in cell wall biosynthesis